MTGVGIAPGSIMDPAPLIGIPVVELNAMACGKVAPVRALETLATISCCVGCSDMSIGYGELSGYPVALALR